MIKFLRKLAALPCYIGMGLIIIVFSFLEYFDVKFKVPKQVMDFGDWLEKVGSKIEG